MSSSLRLWGEGLVWLTGVVVCLLAANCWSNCLLTRAMYGPIVRCGIISSCQPAATSEIVKTLLATSIMSKHVSVVNPFLLKFLFWHNIQNMHSYRCHNTYSNTVFVNSQKNLDFFWRKKGVPILEHWAEVRVHNIHFLTLSQTAFTLFKTSVIVISYMHVLLNTKQKIWPITLAFPCVVVTVINYRNAV